jgi:hypothetical protein
MEYGMGNYWQAFVILVQGFSPSFCTYGNDNVFFEQLDLRQQPQ